jgi:hypothetical protein
VNKHHEQDYVGMRTIEIINKQAEQAEEKKLDKGKSHQSLHIPKDITQASIDSSSLLPQPKSQAKILQGPLASSSLTGVTQSNAGLTQMPINTSGITSATR